MPNLAMVKDVYMNVRVYKANQEASVHLKTLKYANDKCQHHGAVFTSCVKGFIS